jgi:hypothetical protein
MGEYNMLCDCIIVALEVLNVLHETIQEFSDVNACRYIYGIQEAKKNDLALDFLKEMKHFHDHYQYERN